MKVRFASQVELDLGEIAAWIARDDPVAAVRYTAALKERAVELGGMPHAFPIVRRRRGTALRKRTYRSHVIIYRVTSIVVVLLIVHVRRDYLALLRDT